MLLRNTLLLINTMLLTQSNFRVSFSTTILHTTISITITNGQIIKTNTTHQRINTTSALQNRMDHCTLHTALERIRIILATTDTINMTSSLSLILTRLFRQANRVVRQLMRTQHSIHQVNNRHSIAQRSRLSLVALTLRFGTNVNRTHTRLFLLLINMVAMANDQYARRHDTGRHTFTAIIVISHHTNRYTHRDPRTTMFNNFTRTLKTTVNLSLIIMEVE